MTTLHYHAVFLHITLKAAPLSMSLNQVNSVHLFRNSSKTCWFSSRKSCSVDLMSSEQLFTYMQSTQKIQLHLNLLVKLPNN